MSLRIEIWMARIGLLRLSESLGSRFQRARFPFVSITLQNKRRGVYLPLALGLSLVVLPQTAEPQAMFAADFKGFMRS